MAKRYKSPQQIVDKQISRAQQSVPDYLAGVDGVSESPNAKAAEKVSKYAMGVQQAVTDGTYVAANQAVTLDQWKSATKTKGGRNYAAGVAESKQKLLKFQTEYGPIRRSIAETVNAMPDDSFEQRLEKSIANARALHAQPYKARGR